MIEPLEFYQLTWLLVFFFSDQQLVCWFAVQQFLWTWQIRTSILCSMVGELYLPMAEMNQLLWRFCPRVLWISQMLHDFLPWTVKNFVNIADVAWFSSMNSIEANEFTWCGCSICFLAENEWSWSLVPPYIEGVHDEYDNKHLGLVEIFTSSI